MLGRRFQCCLFLVAAVWTVGCGGDDASNRLSQVGQTCSKTGDCDSGLVCLGAVCQQEGAVCPDDRECSGLECGPDPVCGTSCGTCDGDGTCEGGQCVGGSSCEPDCGTPEVLKWVSIPGGTFEMGCSLNDNTCDGDENPPHSVTVSGFEMLETEVTEAQYEAVMDGNPSCNYGGGGGADTPVECVDWSNAKAFCEAIGGRLPTEAEWEYAARGGTTTRYYCGDDAEYLSDIAWCHVNSSGMKHSVKKKKPNAYGLHDMLGNVDEWTNDWYDGSYYESSPSSNPQGPESGSYRVRRGGGFNYGGGSLSVSNRDGDYPSYHNYDLGIRCARSE